MMIQSFISIKQYIKHTVVKITMNLHKNENKYYSDYKQDKTRTSSKKKKKKKRKKKTSPDYVRRFE